MNNIMAPVIHVLGLVLMIFAFVYLAIGVVFVENEHIIAVGLLSGIVFGFGMLLAVYYASELKQQNKKVKKK